MENIDLESAQAARVSIEDAMTYMEFVSNWLYENEYITTHWKILELIERTSVIAENDSCLSETNYVGIEAVSPEIDGDNKFDVLSNFITIVANLVYFCRWADRSKNFRVRNDCVVIASAVWQCCEEYVSNENING